MSRPCSSLPLIFATTAIVACAGPGVFTDGVYTDPREIEVLSDAWSPSDLQLVAKKVVNSLQASEAFASIQGRPVIAVGKLKNSTFEHIDMQSLGDKVQTALVNTGKFRFADRSAREDVAEEHAYQSGGNVRPEKENGPVQPVDVDYVMTGELSSIKQAVGSDELVYYKMTAKLTNVRTGLLEWTDEKELKKKLRKLSIVP